MSATGSDLELVSRPDNEDTMARSESLSQNQRRIQRHEFIGELLIEFPDMTLAEVRKAWKRSGKEGAVSPKDYESVRKQVLWMIRNPGCSSADLGTAAIMRADARRRRREQQAQDARKHGRKYPRGTELSGTALKKMYDEHFEQVLKDHLRVSKDGRGGKYRVDKPLPTLIEYERMKQRAFTIPLGEILSTMHARLSDCVSDLESNLDSMSDRAREGQRGERLNEQSEALGNLACTLTPDRLPPAVARSPYYCPPSAGGQKAANLRNDLQTLRAIVQFLGAQLLPSLDAMRAITPGLLATAQAAAVRKALDAAEAEILRFWQELEEAVGNLDVALSS